MESNAGIDAYSDDDDHAAAAVASSSEDEDSFTFGGSPSSSRLPHRREMSEARWDAEMGVAEVMVRKGKAWHSTGFSRGGRLLAHVEEAV
jgi:tRNA-splicing endonuclease subunit Sen54